MADFNTSKEDGDSVGADEWNQLASIENFIATSGQTPSAGNLNQMGIAASRYSSGGQFYTDSGIANAYVLSPVSPFKSPVSSGSGEGYFVGMIIHFRAGNANTGASTVNVNSAGVKNLKKEDGTTDLDAGDISATQDSVFRYDGTSFVLNTGQASTTAKGIIEIATDAEVIAGTDTQRAITPAGLIAAFANSKTTNGHTYLPNGLIMQWGSQNESNIGTFPIAFPNACLSLIATANVNSFSSDGSVTTSYIVSNSQFRVRIGADNGNLLYWVAIGY